MTNSDPGPGQPARKKEETEMQRVWLCSADWLPRKLAPNVGHLGSTYLLWPFLDRHAGALSHRHFTLIP